MLDKITEALASIAERGSFVTRAHVTPKDLHLEVNGVGNIPLPVSPTRARKLRSVARQAGYGLRDKTLVDTRVRDTWEVARSRIKIDHRRWSKTLTPQLEAIARALGLPASARLKAQLYKMLVYEPGQFFAPHQDSEKVSNMVGTLTVELPSLYKGGSTIIEHRGERVAYRSSKRSAEELTFTAFYADCHHEVKPISEGHRVVLVYNLLFDGPPLRAPESTAPAVSALSKYLPRHFATPTKATSYAREATAPDKLVYLLDHEYSQKSLGWNQLKNGDRLRAAALRAAAERCECEIFLCLADVHETWSCEDEGYGWRRRGRWYEDEEEEQQRQTAVEHPALMDLCESDIELRHWLDDSGMPAAAISPDLSWNELCFTKASVDCDPFESRHEGFMGNYGNTVERWYHRAAVVMWPRASSFLIRAKASPQWAMEELCTMLENGSADEACRNLRALIPWWERAARRFGDKSLLASTLRVAHRLGDPDLSAELLRPAKLSHLSLFCVPHLRSLLAAHGLSWCCYQFLQWSENTSRRLGDIDDEWLGLMPSFCRTLCEPGADAERSLAQWLIDHQWSHIKKNCESLLAEDLYPTPQNQLDDMGKTLIGLIESSVYASHDRARATILDFMTDAGTQYPIAALVRALRHAHDTRRPDTLKSLALGTLHQHCISRLRADLAMPSRRPDDWSITPPGRCPDLLAAFLSASDRIRWEWPLAKQGRQKVHRILDGYRLPVTHTTMRKGSPYTLVLVKTGAIFAQAAKLREAMQADLEWLKAGQRYF